jgi:signal transduction histidine kinase
MMRRIKSVVLITSFLLSFITPHVALAVQVNTIPEIKITSIKSGDTFIDEKDWSNFSVTRGLKLLINYTPKNNFTDLFYRVYLDGIMLNSKYEANSFILSGMNNGVHIFRIIPFTADLIEGTPLVFSFTVRDELPKPEPKAVQSVGGPSISQEIIYTLGGLVLVQLVIIIFLLTHKRTKKGTQEIKEKVTQPKTKNNSQEEIKELKRAHQKVLEELKKQYAENEYLQQKIKELTEDVKSLEGANVRLVEQKEKLTESKHKLEALQLQKEELFAIAIHDIKNPASAIRGYIELLNSYDLNATEQHDIMISLVETSDSIVQLSQNMCSMIAKNMPEPKYKLKPSSINKIIDDVCMQNGSYAKSKKVILKNAGLSTLPDVNMDTDKIEEALDNLVNNAIKYAPPETNVEIRSFIKDANKKYVVVEVKDTGVGLSEEDIKKSFQKGTVLTPKPTGLEQSSGLGLWIVKKIIEEHNGRVYVNSKEGVGSTFGFELPVE